MTKKILLIIGIVVIIGVAVFLVLGENQTNVDGEKTGFSFTNYFPFGQNDTNVDPEPIDQNSFDQDPNTTTNNNTTDQPIPKIRKISGEPVAGAIIFDSGTTTIVRFVEKGTGNVYEARSNSLEVKRLTNTTIPKIIRAVWLTNGSGFLAQTLLPENEIVETSFVALTPNQNGAEVLTPFTTKISKLPTGIKEILVSGDSTKILYYTTSNSSAFYLSNPDGTGAKMIFGHPLTEWLLRYWKNTSSVVLQTKEASGLPTYFYELNTANGSLTKTDNPMTKIVQNLYTLTEKCALPIADDSFVFCAVPDSLPSGTYPDDWYKGTAPTSDSITKIDTEHGVFYNNLNLSSETGQKIDVTEIKISKDKQHLIFKNKIDGYLWLLRLED